MCQITKLYTRINVTLYVKYTPKNFVFILHTYVISGDGRNG